MDMDFGGVHLVADYSGNAMIMLPGQFNNSGWIDCEESGMQNVERSDKRRDFVPVDPYRRWN
jgi:hypothetical protein